MQTRYRYHSAVSKSDGAQTKEMREHASNRDKHQLPLHTINKDNSRASEHFFFESPGASPQNANSIYRARSASSEYVDGWDGICS
jgi:hypothetical protein